MNYKGQPSNRIISRKFVETTVIILFVLNLIATIALLITGIVYNKQDNNEAMYYYISAMGFSKYEKLKIDNPLKGYKALSAERLDELNSYLKKLNTAE